ncbi:MAG: hypothetical protein ACR2NN_10720 [Bryobacteraceae bacterium]
MRYWVSKRLQPFSRVLLVESGSRELLEDLLDGLYAVHPEMKADLVTCYAGLPAKFDPSRGRAYRVGEYSGSPGRRRLFAELDANRYTVIGIVCSGEPIMTKWKWAIAVRLPAKLFILNENGDYFWFDRGHWPSIRHFILFRAGLSGAGAVRTLARLVLFPLTLLYLIVYAATVHLRRKIRTT